MDVFLERQSVRKRKKWGNRLRQVERVLISVAIVFVGLAALYGVYRVIFFGNAFSVERIVVEGEWNHLSADGLASLTGVKENDNLFWVSISDIRKRLHSNLWVRRTAVRRRLPDTLWIYAEEHKPQVIIVVEDGLFFIDEHGEVFKDVEARDEKSYPLLTGVKVDDDLELNDDNRMFVLKMLNILEHFNSSEFGKRYGASEIHYDDDLGYSLITKEKPIHILFGHAAFAQRIAQLDRLRTSFESRAGRITYILASEPGRLIVRYLTS